LASGDLLTQYICQDSFFGAEKSPYANFFRKGAQTKVGYNSFSTKVKDCSEIVPNLGCFIMAALIAPLAINFNINSDMRIVAGTAGMPEEPPC
jgi:hypothetical protein